MHATLINTIKKRCLKYFSADPNSIDFLQVFSIANALGTQVSFSMLKTVLGAWITHRRVQAEPRPCIFCGRGEDSLQHIINCEILWAYISDLFLPFLAFIDFPFALLGAYPISCYQILGTHYAFLVYHSLRTQSRASASDVRQCLHSIAHSTSVHSHLIRAHLGKCNLKPSLKPTQTTQTTDTPYSCTSAQSVSSVETMHASSESFPINMQLRMTCARRAKLAALGYPVGSGPVFHPGIFRGVPGLTRTDVNPLAT